MGIAADVVLGQAGGEVFREAGVIAGGVEDGLEDVDVVEGGHALTRLEAAWSRSSETDSPINGRQDHDRTLDYVAEVHDGRESDRSPSILVERNNGPPKSRSRWDGRSPGFLLMTGLGGLRRPRAGSPMAAIDCQGLFGSLQYTSNMTYC